jgi:TolA-binding protein
MAGRRRWLAACCAAVLAAAGAWGREADPREALDTARAALEDGQPALARKYVERYLERCAGGTAAAQLIEPIGLLARALYEDKRYEEILRVLGPRSHVARNVPDNGAFAYWRALALYELGRTREALEAIEGFATRYPGAGAYAERVARLRAWCDLKSNRAEDALAEFERFARDFPQSDEQSQNLLDWATTLIGLGREDKALEVLGRLTGLPARLPAAQEGRHLAGRLWAGRQEWARVLDTLQPLATNAAAPADLRAEAWLSVAQAHESLGSAAEATNAVQAAVGAAANPDLRQRGTFELGLMLLRMGKVEEGAACLRGQISAKPGTAGSGDAQLQLAEFLFKYDMPEQALAQFQQYLETFTNDVGLARAHRGKGWALGRLGRNAEAAAEFGKAAALFTDAESKGDCLFRVADSQFANGQYEVAADGYRAVLDLFPGGPLTPRALFQLAESLARTGAAAEAERVFRRVAESYPGDTLCDEALLRVGELEGGAGRLQEAIAVYEQAMGTRSNGAYYARALLGRGMARYNLFQFDTAQKDFARVAAEFPDIEAGQQADYMRGMCLYWEGRDGEASAIWRRFIEGHPNSRWAPDVLFWMGKFEYNRGDYPAAERTFLSFATQYPKSALADDALLRSGMSAGKQAQFVRANEILSRLVKEYPDSDKMAAARFEQANALSELAKHSAAILILDEIIAKYPDSDLIPAAWGRKGDCHFVLGGDDPGRYMQSLNAYQTAANHPKAGLDLALQAEYKTGRCLEKMGKADEALEQYYAKVIVRYFAERQKGVWHTEAAKLWFTRAAFNAAAILEAQQDWRQAVRVLDRIVAAGVDGEDEARAQIARIRAEKWWMFR